MLFIDQIQAKGALLRPEFERLFSLAIANQSHPGDLLLVLENGTYNPEVLDYDITPKLNPHVIGPGPEGHSYFTHYAFINDYRSNVYTSTHTDYLAEIEQLIAGKKWPERDKLESFEGLSVQLETLIYLKIWESDFVIKRLYEFVRLLFGESYDWRFKVSEFARDKSATGVRHEIIRTLVRDKVKPLSNIFADSIGIAYKSQIRNSIAHSNYSIMSRNIHPNNYSKNDPGAQIKNLPFDEWIEMFHLTLALYDGLIGLGNKIQAYYASLAATQDNQLEVMLPDTAGTLRPAVIVYRPEFKDFRYKQQGE